MPTPAQSLTFTQGSTKQLSFEHEVSFDEYAATLIVGTRSDDELLALVKEVELSVMGSTAVGSMLVDIPPGRYETQLVLTDTLTSEQEVIFGPLIIVKARIGGWPESP